jgi:hypothetical protein
MFPNRAWASTGSSKLDPGRACSQWPAPKVRNKWSPKEIYRNLAFQLVNRPSCFNFILDYSAVQHCACRESCCLVASWEQGTAATKRAMVTQRVQCWYQARLESPNFTVHVLASEFFSSWYLREWTLVVNASLFSGAWRLRSLQRVRRLRGTPSKWCG